MALDSIGSFLLSNPIVKVGEIQFPANNINIYQEDNNLSGSGDLLTYNEPWGGPQNKPMAPTQNTPTQTPNMDIEHDKPMTFQGERPEVFLNKVPAENTPVTNTTVDGDSSGVDRHFMRGSGPHAHLEQPDAFGDRNSTPVPIGHENDSADASMFTDRVYVYASGGNPPMPRHSKMLEDIVRGAQEKGYVKFNDGANTQKVKIAFLEDLYA